MKICATMNFRVTRVFNESNSCVDTLTNLGVKNIIELPDIIIYLTILDYVFS